MFMSLSVVRPSYSALPTIAARRFGRSSALRFSTSNGELTPPEAVIWQVGAASQMAAICVRFGPPSMPSVAVSHGGSAGIDADSDLVAIKLKSLCEELWILQRGTADDRTRRTGLDDGIERLGRPDAAADFDGSAERLDDACNDLRVLRRSRQCTV